MKKVILFFTLIIVLFSAHTLLAQENVAKGVINPSEISPGTTVLITVTFTIPEGMHQSLQEDYFYIEADEVEGIEFLPVQYPEGTEHEGLIDYYNSVILTMEFIVADDAMIGEREIKVYAGYQFCDDAGMCHFPEEEEISLSVNVVESSSSKKSSGLLKYLLLALLGGLILNITPCVLPVLSIKAISLVNQSQHDKKKILAGSYAYTAGVLVSFIILAIVIVIIKASGELVGWGFQFQNPGFVLVLLSIIFVFSLSLFGVFTIRVPGMQIASKASGKGGHTGSFLTGIFAVVLATPCSAPLLGSAIGFAFTQTAPIIILLFLFVGIGLALPFMLIGFCPKLIQKIPKPGTWMNIFEQIMGFLLLAAVIWLLDVLYFQVGWANVLRVMIFMAFLAIASWIYGRFALPHFSRKKQWIAMISALLVIVLSAIFVVRLDVLAEPVYADVISESHGNWEKFEPELIEKLRLENKPIFIDFTAKWCMTCKVNENAVLYTDDIQQEFADKSVVLVKADYTNKDKLIGEWLQKFGKAGVPTYVLYIPGKENPLVLPEIITKEIVRNALNKIPELGE